MEQLFHQEELLFVNIESTKQKESLFTNSFSMHVQGGKRSDGRTPKEIRPINSSCSILPRAHGSALFTRGETQVCDDFSLSSSLCLDVLWCWLYMRMQLRRLDTV